MLEAAVMPVRSKVCLLPQQLHQPCIRLHTWLFVMYRVLSFCFAYADLNVTWIVAMMQVFTVGLGTPENARLFARELNYPLEHLYADPSGACYKALGFNPGFAADVDINPYLKLLPMLMGIGSPGTVQEVR